MKRVYLDHNSTTTIRPEARDRWLEVADSLPGNPSSLHAAGRRARALIDDSRSCVASALDVHEEEIFFTSGATESNNLALFGVLDTAQDEGGLLTTTAEHSSVLAPARQLAARGHPLVLAPIDKEGQVDADALARGVAENPIGLISIAAANNETGVLADLRAIKCALDALPGRRPPLHTDAVQALGRIPVRLREWGVDLASFSGHKLGGPPGVGVLWRARGVSMASITHGGAQELGIRPGTENVPGIAATALAIELAVREQAAFAERTATMRSNLWAELHANLKGLRLVGPPIDSKQRLPNTLCVIVPDTDGKVLVTRLDLAGLEVSAGSACASGSIEPSHVLLAMGLSRDEARSGLRLSLGRTTTSEDCKRAATVFNTQFSSSRAR